MPHQITSLNFDLSPSLTQLAQEKLAKIDKHVEDFGEDLRELRLVINKGPRFGYRVKVEVFLPGGTFVAKEGGFSIEGTIDEAVREVIRQIDKHKGKLGPRDRARAVRKLKNWLFFSKISGEI